MTHIRPPRPHFDVSRDGTPEGLWRGAALACPEWSPTPAPLLVVAPHPDDETLGAGGLMHTMTRAGSPVTVVSVTDGEAAFPDWRDLRAVRVRELDEALRLLGGSSIKIRRLHLPDGRVFQTQSALREAILGLVRPTSILVAPYEQDGHPDHEAVGKVCVALAAEVGLRLVRYPIWAWHHADVDMLADPHWIRLSLTEESARAKSSALRCFRSQFEPPGRLPIVPAHVLPYFQRNFEIFAI